MTIETITNRTVLGSLRLPWCVDRKTRTEPIRINDERERIGEALSIRVRDVTDARVRMALSSQEASGGTSLQKIEAIVAEAEGLGREPEVGDAAAFRIDGDLLLMEGCHRTCATYLLDPPSFRLQIVVVDGGWEVYSTSGLEVT